MDAVWSLTPDRRRRIAQRTGENLFSLIFEAEKECPEEVAMDAAIRLEEEAYVAARAQSSTTTGTRPLTESAKIYIHKLAELVVDFAKEGTKKTTLEAGEQGILDLSGGGTRDFLSKEKAETLFASIFENGGDIHTVIMSTKSFGIEAADVASRALLKIKATLQVANLGDIIGGRPEQEALRVLEILSEALSKASLRKLDLSNNALGEKGLRACATLFQSQAKLEELVLHNIGCSPDACKALKDLTSCMQLRGLFLYNNMSGDEGGSAVGDILSKMPSVQHFQMASSRVGSEGILSLSQGLSKADALRSLDLNDNPATADSVPAIVKILNTQRRLSRLNLSDCALGDDGIVTLSAALTNSVPELEVLELGLNEVTFEGMQHLAVALMSKKKLRSLDLHENELEDAGALVLAKAIHTNSCLERLNVVGNGIHRSSALTIVKALKEKQKFETLSIDDNRISADGIEEMKALLTAIFGGIAVLGSLEENEEEEDDVTFMDIDIDKTDLDRLVEKLNALSVD